MKKLLIAAALFAAISAPCAFADATSGTITGGLYDLGDGWSQMIWTWTSDSAGRVVSTRALPQPMELRKVWIEPTVSGTTVPTTLFDVVINDQASKDLLYTKGGDKVITGDTGMYPFATSDGVTTRSFVPVVNGNITLKITNAGNAKTGKVRLILKR